MWGGISCAGHSVSLAAMKTGIVPIFKLPHSSSYTPQNLLKAGGKGRLIRKALSPWRQHRACSMGRGGLLTSQDAGARQQHCTAWGKQVHKANRPALRWQQDHFIRSLFIKNKHTTFKKEKKKIPAKLGLTQLCGGPVLEYKRCIPKWKCSVPQRWCRH